MSYIGKTPTSVPLTSSDITDGIISLPKLTDGTDGNLISYDASGNPVAVATGTDGQVLTSAGAGAPPVFETLPTNTPAFMATLSSTQNVADNVDTKVSANTELFDTDSAYDNATNYRFTPQVAGKYFVFGSVFCDPATASDLVYGRAYIYKNGSQVKKTTIDFRNTAGREVVVSVSVLVDMNGSSDYVELFGNVNASDGAGMNFAATDTFWGAYKIIT
jgi:hypothetical protein